MDRQDRRFEHRKSYRCPIPAGQVMAELQVGKRWIAVQLFNESAGGFAACAEQNPGLKTGDTTRLATTGGDFEVRVAYVSNTPEEGASETSQGRFRLGLERVSELEPLARRAPWESQLGCSQVRGFPAGIPTVLVVAMLLVAGALGALLVLWNIDSPLVEQLARWGNASQDPAGNARMSLAEAAQQAGLTETQQRDISQIADLTARTLQQFDAQWAADTSQQRARKRSLVVRGAQQEIKKRLGDEQWEKMRDWGLGIGD